VVNFLPVFGLLRKTRKLATLLGTQVIDEKAAALENGMDPGDDLYAYLRRYLVWSILAYELTSFSQCAIIQH
jgi:hypothetical protein